MKLGTLQPESTFYGQLLFMRRKGRQAIMGGCCTQCILYSVYALLGVCCAQCMLYMVNALFGVCCVWCILYSVYAGLGVC